MTWRALSSRSHVIQRIMDARLLSHWASHDVASNICTALLGGAREVGWGAGGAMGGAVDWRVVAAAAAVGTKAKIASATSSTPRIAHEPSFLE